MKTLSFFINKKKGCDPAAVPLTFYNDGIQYRTVFHKKVLVTTSMYCTSSLQGYRTFSWILNQIWYKTIVCFSNKGNC